MDDEEWMDLFDDNSSDEDSVEPNPDDMDTATALSTEPSSVCVDCAPPKRKKRSSNKRQKQQILGALEELNEVHVSDSINAIIVKQLHMQVYPERSQFFQLVTTTHKDTFIATCKYLMQLFCDVYRQCDRGKEKYIQFQVKWHKILQASYWTMPVVTHASQLKAQLQRVIPLKMRGEEFRHRSVVKLGML